MFLLESNNDGEASIIKTKRALLVQDRRRTETRAKSLVQWPQVSGTSWEVNALIHFEQKQQPWTEQIRCIYEAVTVVSALCLQRLTLLRLLNHPTSCKRGVCLFQTHQCVSPSDRAEAIDLS